MKISLKKRSGKFLDVFELDEDVTVETFKALFYERFHYYPERQRWTVSSTSGVVLKDGLLKDFGVVDGTSLFFKDLGVQISWRLVFVVEYLGPLLIFPIVYFLPNAIYTWTHYQIGELKDERDGSWLEADIHKEKALTQTVALLLVLFHFLKREVETLFIHRFSNATMAIVRVPINCGHYWVLCGLFVSYFLFHPQYTAPWNEETQKPIIYTLAALMIVFECLNFKTHLILRNLRPRGTKERGVPKGWGFGQVACANYTWETLAWIMFCLLTHTATAYLFSLVGFLQMTQWAWKKQSIYRRDFKDYPRRRKAIIPWLL